MKCSASYYRPGDFHPTRCPHPARYKAVDKRGNFWLLCGSHRNSYRHQHPARYIWTTL